jgi:hypothetical protein
MPGSGHAAGRLTRQAAVASTCEHKGVTAERRFPYPCEGALPDSSLCFEREAVVARRAEVQQRPSKARASSDDAVRNGRAKAGRLTRQVHTNAGGRLVRSCADTQGWHRMSSRRTPTSLTSGSAIKLCSRSLATILGGR